MKNFYLTTAISYPNAKPHIGHAYEAIITDSLARYYKQKGFTVRLQTGTDEHGLKMLQTANKRGIFPQELANEMSGYFKEMCDKLNINHDNFVRTTNDYHKSACQELWRKMVAKGDIYLDSYQGWYSIIDETYYDEKELVNGLSPEGNPVEWVSESSYFFRLSKYQDSLLNHIQNNPDFIQPESRKNEVLGFIKTGLKDISISRSNFSWGVKVPNDNNHVMYVWLDALTNYLSGLGFQHNSKDFNNFWGENANVIHIVGKDIIRFHAILWPAFLMSADLPLPNKIFAHGFLLNKGEKMSKSLGNVDCPVKMAEDYGVDSLRYFLLREISLGQDGGYSHEAIITRNNADLANNLGNLVQRCLKIVHKNFEGRIPHCENQDENLNQSLDKVFAMLSGGELGITEIFGEIENIFKASSEVNKYFADNAPWEVLKTDKAKAGEILYNTMEAIKKIAIMLRWVLPESSDIILDYLGFEGNRKFEGFNERLEGGVLLKPSEIVFRKF